GVTFDDVAGCDASKLELREVVEFLKSPGKFLAVGARAPRGVLLEGPPGTGKTLLARAVAGEAGVPFLSASGSEFVEMFVGVGASRIRDLFDRAKKNSPCIIFIDEVDAIGKSRGGGAGMGGGNDEREQTLNQILTEMDGFDKSVDVVVIAATNRADVLDPALLRPGRFDRRVPVELPDRVGRLAILHVHSKDKPLGKDVNLVAVAARTTGFSGAALANLMNEAAIVTARRDKTELGNDEIEYALDRLTVGLEQRTGMASDARKRLVAYHEAGHAVMGALTPGFDAVGKVTIVPRSSGAGGFTLFVPDDERTDSGLYSRKYLEATLRVALGGRVAEEVVYGADEVTTGASSDLQRVADLARKMVTQWGFAAETLGLTAWEQPTGNNWSSPKMASEATQQRIDAEVEKIVRAAYEQTRATIEANRKLLDKLVDELVEHETIGNDELMRLVGKHSRAAVPAT
ncbi:peptidase family M41-domain-containing protein, partial [Pavlovales sp. CCMP2436]